MLGREDQEFEARLDTAGRLVIKKKEEEKGRAKSGSSSPELFFPAFCGHPTPYYLPQKGGRSVNDLFYLTQSD